MTSLCGPANVAAPCIQQCVFVYVLVSQPEVQLQTPQ